MKQIKKYLILAAMILTLSVCTAGCGGDEEETLAETETTAISETELLASKSDSGEPESETESKEGSTASAKKTISEEKAREALVDTFGNIDEATGEKNIFTYDKIVTIDGVDYYTYEWSGEDGTYYCNAFVKTDGSDVLTGIYADGKWEIGSDGGWDDGSSYEEGSDDEYDGEEDLYEDEEEEPYDDGFGDIDPEYEEEASDEELIDEEL